MESGRPPLSRTALRRRRIVDWVETGIYTSIVLVVYVVTGLALRWFGV